MKKTFVLIILVIAAWFVWHNHPHLHKPSISKTVAEFLPCANNQSGKKVIVSESRRHMWACDGRVQVANYPVVTGYSGYAATVTPLGSYTISDKLIGIPLKGSDQLGSWNVFVKYWMPFLHNQYGDYGFHDASWRGSSDFGNISDSSRQASHGCVEMPLAGMKWLYNWAPVGTKVSVVS